MHQTQVEKAKEHRLWYFRSLKPDRLRKLLTDQGHPCTTLEDSKLPDRALKVGVCIP